MNDNEKQTTQHNPWPWDNPDYWTHQSCGKCLSCFDPETYALSGPGGPGYCDNCGCAHCQLDRAS